MGERLVLVTGASGFIGRRLCAALRGQAHVRAVLHHQDADGPWDESVCVDLAREDLARSACDGVDAVFHFAGKAHGVSERSEDEADYQRVNVDGTRRVLEAARASGVRRFVFGSSVKAMGENDHHAGPTTAYGRSKLAAEQLVLHGGYAPEPVVLRLSLVYGEGVEGNLGGMLRAVAAGRFPPPPRVANRRSMVHVDDVVRAAIAASQRAQPVGRVLVIGDGVPYSTYGIYAAMRRALGSEPARVALPTPAWRLLARAGDLAGTVLGRRAPFDSAAYAKLFGSAWYQPCDWVAMLGVRDLKTLDEALPHMVASLGR
jgi:UDP-glucose 4-epimerase